MKLTMLTYPKQIERSRYSLTTLIKPFSHHSFFNKHDHDHDHDHDADSINGSNYPRVGPSGSPQIKAKGALRSGAEVLTVKKSDAGSNKKTGSGPVLNARKLEEGTELAALERVAGEVRHAIQKARVEKKMSQAELAKQINERTQVVQEYENGKAVPNQAVLAKMERVLGVKLRGKIGK